MTALDTDLLAELIRRKHDCLVQIDELGRRQDALIADHDMAQLLKLLAAKQQLLGQLQQIEKALDPFRGQKPEARTWRSSELRDQCADLLRRCETLLAAIVARENEGQARLRGRRDEAAAQLQGHHDANRARGAYVAQGRGDTNRLDLSSES